MSRTHKDLKWKLKDYPSGTSKHDLSKARKHKREECPHLWIRKLPSWFRNIFMEVPYRRSVRKFEKEVVKLNTSSLDTLIQPTRDKRVVYYY